MAKLVTERQQQVLDFIKDYIDDHQMPPTQEEIRNNFGWTSRNAVPGHLAGLAAKRKIQWTPKLSRAIKVLG